MNLADAQIAVLAENQYQELELWYPVLRLREAGANVVVVAPAAGQVYASKLGYPVTPDFAVGEFEAADLDAVVIPGGFAPEGMRRHKPMVDLVRKVHDQGSLVAAICHAGWMLASAGIARGRRLTCVPIIKDDVINAGGDYVDEAVVRDGNLITSRLPSDLPLFCSAIVRYFEEAPRRRNDGRTLLPPSGRPASAHYAQPARLAMAPRGKASANYTTVALSGERCP
ncbi:MAG: type 1 glutamine amidotransferase domain-containing protein [Alphaproteobacteria bacterium]